MGFTKSFGGYFPTSESSGMDETAVHDEYLDEIVGLHQSQLQQQLFRTTTFFEILIPFVTTYLCDQSFLRMVDMKAKKRNRLYCENDMWVVLAQMKPRISEVVSERQQQKLHLFVVNIHWFAFLCEIYVSLVLFLNTMILCATNAMVHFVH